MAYFQTSGRKFHLVRSDVTHLLSYVISFVCFIVVIVVFIAYF